MSKSVASSVAGAAGGVGRSLLLGLLLLSAVASGFHSVGSGLPARPRAFTTSSRSGRVAPSEASLSPLFVHHVEAKAATTREGRRARFRGVLSRVASRAATCVRRRGRSALALATVLAVWRGDGLSAQPPAAHAAVSTGTSASSLSALRSKGGATDAPTTEKGSAVATKTGALIVGAAVGGTLMGRSILSVVGRDADDEDEDVEVGEDAEEKFLEIVGEKVVKVVDDAAPSEVEKFDEIAAKVDAAAMKKVEATISAAAEADTKFDQVMAENEHLKEEAEALKSAAKESEVKAETEAIAHAAAEVELEAEKIARKEAEETVMVEAVALAAAEAELQATKEEKKHAEEVAEAEAVALAAAEAELQATKEEKKHAEEEAAKLAAEKAAAEQKAAEEAERVRAAEEEVARVRAAQEAEEERLAAEKAAAEIRENSERARIKKTIDDALLMQKTEKTVEARDSIGVHVRAEENIQTRASEIEEARRQPKPENVEAKLQAKYGAMDLEERAFSILFDLGMIEMTPDPEDPEYDSTYDDELAPENTYV